MTSDARGTHLEDHDLFRALDPDDASFSAVAARAHVLVCPGCAEALERTRRSLGRVSEELDRIQPSTVLLERVAAATGSAPVTSTAPRAPSLSGSRRGWWKAALLAGLLLTPLLASASVRSAVGEWLDGLREASPASAPAPDVAAAPPRTLWLPAGSTFRVERTSATPGGALLIRRWDSDGAELRLPRGPSAPEALVFSGGVRLSGGEEAIVELRIGPGVERVVLVGADGRERIVVLGTMEDSARVPLP